MLTAIRLAGHCLRHDIHTLNLIRFNPTLSLIRKHHRRSLVLNDRNVNIRNLFPQASTTTTLKRYLSTDRKDEVSVEKTITESSETPSTKNNSSLSNTQRSSVPTMFRTAEEFVAYMRPKHQLQEEKNLQWNSAADLLISRSTVYWAISMITAFIVSNTIYYLYFNEPEVHFLSAEEFHPFKLYEMIPVTETTSLFRFEALIDPSLQKNLPVPFHLIVKDDSCQISREYTPITISSKGFDLLVKKYENGSISNLIHNLQPGDSLECRGPVESFPYERGLADEIGMIAGGTGITPFYQLIKSVLNDPLDTKTRFSLMYCNRSIHDIPLKNELEFLANKYPDRLKLKFVVDTLPPTSPKKLAADYSDALNPLDYEVGYVDAGMIQKYMPDSNNPRSLVILCGPDAMVEHLGGKKPSFNRQGRLTGLLRQCGYTEKNVFKF